MKITRTVAGLATVALLVVPAAPAFAQDTTLNVTGSGAQEVPGPGEDGSTVTGAFSFDEAAGTITYTVSVAGNAEPAAAGHLHEAAAGAAGPVVVTLDAAAINAGTEATVEVDAALIAEIVANPQDYYLNVHSPSFPAGFARAQLADGAISEAAPTQEPAPTSVPAGDGSSSVSTALLGSVVIGAGAAAVAVGVARRRRDIAA